MKIYFVTHSTTKDNEAGISSGWKDAELSELGIQQAKELGERLKNIKIIIMDFGGTFFTAGTGIAIKEAANKLGLSEKKIELIWHSSYKPNKGMPTI